MSLDSEDFPDLQGIKTAVGLLLECLFSPKTSLISKGLRQAVALLQRLGAAPKTSLISKGLRLVLDVVRVDGLGSEDFPDLQGIKT